MMSRRLICWLAVLAWMALIFWFSSAGHDVSSAQSGGVVDAIRDITGITLTEHLVRKTAHVTLYAVLGILVCLLTLQYTQQWRKVWVISVAAVALYATSDEMHQIFIGGRSAQVGDVLLDTLAGAVTISLLLYARQYKLLNKQNKL